MSGDLWGWIQPRVHFTGIPGDSDTHPQAAEVQVGQRFWPLSRKGELSFKEADTGGLLAGTVVS